LYAAILANSPSANTANTALVASALAPVPAAAVAAGAASNGEARATDRHPHLLSLMQPMGDNRDRAAGYYQYLKRAPMAPDAIWAVLKQQRVGTGLKRGVGRNKYETRLCEVLLSEAGGAA